MSCFYPIPGPRTFGPFGPCPPPWIYPCNLACPAPCDEPCDKLEPGSISMNDRLYTVNATPASTTINIGWSKLLDYNTIVITLNGNQDTTLVTYTINIGGIASEESKYIKCYKEKNCVKHLGSSYLATEIIIKMVGNVKANVYQYQAGTAFTLVSNDFYDATSTTSPSLKTHHHFYFIIEDGCIPTTKLEC